MVEQGSQPGNEGNAQLDPVKVARREFVRSLHSPEYPGEFIGRIHTLHEALANSSKDNPVVVYERSIEYTDMALDVVSEDETAVEVAEELARIRNSYEIARNFLAAGPEITVRLTQPTQTGSLPPMISAKGEQALAVVRLTARGNARQVQPAAQPEPGAQTPVQEG